MIEKLSCEHRFVKDLMMPWEECHEGGDFLGISSGEVEDGGEGCTCDKCGLIWGTDEINPLVTQAIKKGEQFTKSYNKVIKEE